MFRVVWRVVRVVRLDWACCDLSELFGELIEFVEVFLEFVQVARSAFRLFATCSVVR